MLKYKYGNNPLKTKKYIDFWERNSVKRPLVGFSFKNWFPFKEFSACSKWKSLDYLTPGMIKPNEFMIDQKRLLEEGEIIDDDIFRGASPLQAVPWLAAALGNKIRILKESLLSEERRLSWEQVKNIKLDYNNLWFIKNMEYLDVLIESSGGDYPISFKIGNGPSDLVGTLRGTEQSIVDCIDEPKKIRKLLFKLAEIIIEIYKEAYKRIPNCFGGYFDAQYQLWAPGPIIRFQEDASSLYSPKLYREFLQPVDKEIARHFTHSFIHLHSTSMFILDAFLEIEELKGFEINNDIMGPPIKEMIPFFKMIQDANKPLIIRGSFSPKELYDLTEALDPKGLYLYIMVSDIKELEKLRDVLDM